MIKPIPQHILDMPLEARYIYSTIFYRRYDDTNFFCSFCGMPGTGKTTSAIKMAYELQVHPKTLERNFDPEEQIVFSVKDYSRKVQSIDEKKDPGKVIIYDEIEIDSNARGFGAISEQLELIISTMRFKKTINFVTLPHEMQLQKNVRRLRNARVDNKFVNHSQGFSYGKFYYLDYMMVADVHKKSVTEAKHMFPTIPIPTIDGVQKKLKVKSMKFMMPPKPIIRKYKKMKATFLNDFYAKQLAFWDKREKQDEDTGVTFSEACEFIDKFKSELVHKHKVNAVLLADMMKISESKASKYASAYNFKKKIKLEKRASFVD